MIADPERAKKRWSQSLYALFEHVLQSTYRDDGGRLCDQATRLLAICC